MSGEQYRIGELARELGTTTKTLRFYERIGLIEPPPRAANGYRAYAPALARRVRLVVELRRLGFSIEELKQLDPAGSAPELRPRLVGLMDEKLREWQVTLAVMQGRHDDLAARCESLMLTPGERPGSCVCDALRCTCTCEEPAS